ncbi:CRISPR-associated protein, Cmr5 family [Seinonella peptonophila]|uniref:CRISPR type III-B/RAMP module-associated protein Cmr5 n=1 Tax=Seinonella peptonophila TaxID=112248 RepID=A0A1M5BN80_9BACL|nr:type III-B CRISPR module-associated protein Cmr5 [Seinonella peptonophila]SHF43662.1 CRISPR-associated protein, Cmr5 family [Seinonella peptonophila]
MGHVNLEQQRAQHSLAKIEEMQRLDKQTADDYATYVTSFPAAILINGLGQALAQLLAAAKRQEDEPHFLLYKHIEEWLCRIDKQAPYSGKAELLNALMGGSRQTYIWATQETMLWLQFHKKMANAHLKIKE